VAKKRGTVGWQLVVLEAYLVDTLNSVSPRMYGRGLYRVLVGKPKERDHLKDLDVDGKIMLKRTFKK
jgi:hypothetical protein